MRKVLLVGALGVLLIVGFLVFSSSDQETQPKTVVPTSRVEKAEVKASFAIFTNGTFRIFTDSKYHNLSPDVYVEPPNVNIINVKKKGVTWDDFFKTLPMKLTSECLTTGMGQTFCTKGNQTLKFYINGKLDSNALNRTINAGDQLLVSYGSEGEQEIKKQLEQIPTPEK